MNIAVQKFADEANAWAHLKHTQWTGPEEMNPNWIICRDTKFAELVVLECIRQVDLDNGYGDNDWDRALSFISKHLKDQLLSHNSMRAPMINERI